VGQFLVMPTWRTSRGRLSQANRMLGPFPSEPHAPEPNSTLARSAAWKLRSIGPGVGPPHLVGPPRVGAGKFGYEAWVLVKRILRKYGYPPDKQEKATLTVLEQAEVLSANWAIA
jgi:hypothetical protein